MVNHGNALFILAYSIRALSICIGEKTLLRLSLVGYQIIRGWEWKIRVRRV